MLIPVSVKKTLLLGEQLPYNPAAETALQPLKACLSTCLLLRRGVLSTDTGTTWGRVHSEVRHGEHVALTGKSKYSPRCISEGGYGQFSKVQSGKMGPAHGRFELSKGISK